MRLKVTMEPSIMGTYYNEMDGETEVSSVCAEVVNRIMGRKCNAERLSIQVSDRRPGAGRGWIRIRPDIASRGIIFVKGLRAYVLAETQERLSRAGFDIGKPFWVKFTASRVKGQ